MQEPQNPQNPVTTDPLATNPTLGNPPPIPNTNFLSTDPLATGNSDISIPTSTNALPDAILPPLGTIDQKQAVPAQELNAQPASKKGLCLILGFFMLSASFIAMALGGGFLYGQIKSRYVPYLSPLIEDQINTPAEQLSLRLDTYSKVLEYLGNEQALDTQSKTSSDDPIKDFFSNLTALDAESEIRVQYDMEQTPVLGLDITAGMVDDTTLQEMGSAKSGEVNFFLNNVSELLNEQGLNSKATIQAQYIAAGNEIGMELETIQIANPTTQEMYFHLTKFPENPYINTDQILNQWVKVSLNDLGYSPEDITQLANQYYLGGEGDVMEDLVQELKIQIPKFKTLLATDTFQKALSISESASVNGEQVKCYNFHLDSTNIVAITYEIAKVYNMEDPTYIEQNSDIPSFDIKFCFDSLLMIRKLGLDVAAQDSYATINLQGYFQINSFNQSYNIEAPQNNLINFNDVDWELVAPTLLMELNPSNNFSETRNVQRASDVNQILNALSQYRSEAGNSINDFENLTYCSEEYNFIGKDIGLIDLESQLVDEYIVGIPFDPQIGSDNNTGYTMCLAEDDRIEITAPFAEQGQFISVSR